jgi:hypothetical protein
MKRRSVYVVAAGAVALAVVASAFGRSRHERSKSAVAIAIRLSRKAIPPSNAWQRYDEAPNDSLVGPVRIAKVSGDVSNPQALVHPTSGSSTTLTYSPGGAAPQIVLDYGQEVSGFATFDVASTSGTTIRAAYAERLANLSPTGDLAATTGPFFSGNGSRVDDFPTASAGTVTAPIIQGGQRYELVTLGSPGTVSIHSAGFDFTPLRATPANLPGHFLSSDDLLNRVWYAGVYTLNLNELTPGTSVLPGSVNQAHLLMDGAKRDRAIWSGDHLISDQTDYYSSDPRYVRDSLLLFGSHPANNAGELQPTTGQESRPGPLPGACSPNPNANNRGCVTWSASYSIVFVPALYEYYLHTADAGFVREMWQSVIRQMAWDAQQVDSNRLFSVTLADDDDWNLENVPGELTYVNALYEQALLDAARLAPVAGDASMAPRWLAAAQTLKDAINRNLWDAKTGVYDTSTTERGSVVQDANATAVLAGIPTPGRARGILAVVSRVLGTRYGALNTSSPVPANYKRVISPYMGSFNVFADFAAGEEAAALKLIRTEWGWMLRNDPGGVDWERIEPNGNLTALDSAAHAWSTGPTAALSQYVLGVVPATPGYASWLIAPEPGDLEWAQGVVPTPRGPIAIRWRKSDRDHDRDVDSFVLTMSAPRGSTGTVAIPMLGHRHSIACDGRLVWNGRRARGGARARMLGGYVQFSAIAGTHTFAWAATRGR